MTENVTCKKGDYGYYLTFSLKESDGTTAFDLTGATSIKLKMVAISGSSLSLNVTCAIYGTATDGVCRYLVEDGDFATADDYKAEVEATYAATDKVLTTETFYVFVKSDLP